MPSSFNTSNEMKRINFTEPHTNEDCLYLNIYTPIINKTTSSGLKLPVMLWIYGGGFITRSGHAFDGGMLAALHNVVVVTINYRLGILGFFNLPGTDIKGNYGMLDQIGAMKWIQKNIQQFGGDPGKVTIFGESAGAFSVALHLISPLSKGLFSRAISESGSAVYSHFDNQVKDDTKAREFLKGLGCTNIKTALECMRKQSVATILKHQSKYLFSGDYSLALPSIDGRFLVDGVTKMMKEKAIKRSSVPYLLGFNLNEGTMSTPWPQNQSTFEAAIKRYSKKYPNKDAVEAAISFEYTDWKTTNSDPLRWYRSLADFLGDDTFKIGAVGFANYWAEIGNTAYVYHFTYRPANLRMPLWGVAHGIDIDFVFGPPLYPTNHVGHIGFMVNSTAGYTKQDMNVSKSVMEMWTNFAKSGDPGNGWPRYTTTKKEFMNIGSEMKVETHAVGPKRMALWTDVIPKLNNISKDATECKPTSGVSRFQSPFCCSPIQGLVALVIFAFIL